MSRVEIASDVFVCFGVLVVIVALAVIWEPLGLLAFGVGLIALGFVFFMKAKAIKAQQDKS